MSTNALSCSTMSTFLNKGNNKCFVTLPIPAPQSREENETFDNGHDKDDGNDKLMVMVIR